MQKYTSHVPPKYYILTDRIINSSARHTHAAHQLLTSDSSQHSTSVYFFLIKLKRTSVFIRFMTFLCFNNILLIT